MAVRVWGEGSGGGTDGDWSNADNWTDDTLPTSSDDVVIDSAYNQAITSGSPESSYKSLTIDGLFSAGIGQSQLDEILLITDFVDIEADGSSFDLRFDFNNDGSATTNGIKIKSPSGTVRWFRESEKIDIQLFKGNIELENCLLGIDDFNSAYSQIICHNDAEIDIKGGNSFDPSRVTIIDAIYNNSSARTTVGGPTVALANTNTNFLGYSGSNENWLGQTFTTGKSGNTDYNELWVLLDQLAMDTSLNASCRAEVYETTGGLPTGSPLAVSEVVNLEIPKMYPNKNTQPTDAVFFSEARHGIQFKFTSTFTLNNTDTYALVLRPIGQSGDWKKSVRIRGRSSTSGGLTSTNDGATWSTTDFTFPFVLTRRFLVNVTFDTYALELEDQIDSFNDRSQAFFFVTELTFLDSEVQTTSDSSGGRNFGVISADQINFLGTNRFELNKDYNGLPEIYISGKIIVDLDSNQDGLIAYDPSQSNELFIQPRRNYIAWKGEMEVRGGFFADFLWEEYDGGSEIFYSAIRISSFGQNATLYLYKEIPPSTRYISVFSHEPSYDVCSLTLPQTLIDNLANNFSVALNISDFIGIGNAPDADILSVQKPKKIKGGF